MDLWLYVYGNGDFIYDILTSVNFFMNNASNFFQISALLALILFAVESTGVMPTRGYDWSKFFRVYVLISIFVVTPYPGKVNVHDVITNQDRVFNFRDGKLPFGLIFPIATTSTVIYRLITLYQQNFEIDENLTYPTSLNYSYSGMNFGANFIQSLDNADSYDANFNYNLDQYMQNCGFPLINKSGALSELRTSADIFATLAKYTSAARFVQQVDFIEGTTIIVKPCDQALTEINAYYDNHADAILLANAKQMGVSTTSGFDRFLNSANASASTLLSISQGAASALKQAIGMNVLMASLKSGAQSVGNGSLALAAYDAEQFQQYKTTSALSGAASARTIPILVGVAFALLFFLYPIIIFLAIAMGSYRAIGVYFQIVVGINLIPLIYEILNYMTTFYLEKKLGVVIAGQGYTYDVSTSLYSFTDNMIIAGNYLATATPIIAYAIVTGSSTALTSVFGHINDPAKQQANSVGHEYALGNQHIGNTAIDTHSQNMMQSNKLDDQFSMTSGSPLMKNTTPGGINTNVGGQNYDINYKSDPLASINYAQTATHSLENGLRHNQDQMSSLGKSWGQQSERLSNLSNRVSSGHGYNNSVGSDEANRVSKAQELSNRIGLTLSANAKAGVSLFGSGGGVEGSVNGGVSSSVADSLGHDLSEYNRLSEDLSHSSSREISSAFNQSSQLTATTSSTLQETVARSQALSDIKSNQSAVNTNFNNDFTNSLHEQGLDPTMMNATEQTERANKFVEQFVNEKYGVTNNLNTPTNKLNNDSLAHGSPRVDTQGLSRPDGNNNEAINVSNHRAQVQAAIDNFKNHQGNTIGNQVADQTKTTGHVIMDAAAGLSNAVVGTAKFVAKNTMDGVSEIFDDSEKK